MKSLKEDIKWVFSGIGVVILTATYNLIKEKVDWSMILNWLWSNCYILLLGFLLGWISRLLYDKNKKKGEIRTDYKVQEEDNNSILVIPYSQDINKVPSIGDVIAIENSVMGSLDFNNIKELALIQGTKFKVEGVKIKYLVAGIFTKNPKKKVNYDYILTIEAIKQIGEIKVTRDIKNNDSLFSLESLRDIV